ncbi:MAG: D-alanyl-D-alanine carboxypeptidase/D-alanyl-D-alanine-endopeptidase, partial [Solirubrobacterales bacterium]|nr:D-alanyl-D-alanine carboxypeptidase/D-alanyl-D-alanine-endopeptidase [Solirubrobacterales bacterium]
PAATLPGAGIPSGGARLSASGICPRLKRLARTGNGRAGLMVKDLGSGKTVCGLNAKGSRSLASNTKLFTTSTALARLGQDHRFKTRVFTDGRLNGKGVLSGSLYLRGGGDPTLGTDAFLDSYLAGRGASISKLAARVRRAGVKRVTGRLFGDDTIFDRLRGVADSGYSTSPWIGPLSGLSFNAGFTNSSLSRFSVDPAKLATKSLVRELRKRGVKIRPEIAMRKTPAKARSQMIARQGSPNLTWMARLTNLNSNNFFAETLLKDIGAMVRGSGTTRSGAIAVRRYAAGLGSTVSPVDGSGLTISNRSSAADVVTLLNQVRRRPFGKALIESLPVAGRDGTLADRMKGTAAAGRCHAKTGTLTGVSALSGYCYNRSGRKFAFSILMNSVRDTYAARAAQDRIAALIAAL